MTAELIVKESKVKYVVLIGIVLLVIIFYFYVSIGNFFSTSFSWLLETKALWMLLAIPLCWIAYKILN